MELWPGISKVSKVDATSKKKKGKGTSREAGKWTNYPVINYGGLSAATLVKVNDGLEWRFVHSKRKGSLTTYGEPVKIYPMVKPEDIRVNSISLKQRAEHGARFMRTYHPDIDIPSDLIMEELGHSDKVAEERMVFDPFKGNAIAAAYCYEGPRKRSVAIAFPTGILGRDLNVSPAEIRQDGLLFQPRAQSLWSFDTPICQIASSSPAVNTVQKKSYHLAVRTYNQISVFDIRNQIVPAFNTSKPPYALSELMTLCSSELDSGEILDMYLSTSYPTDLFLVTAKGVGHQCSLRNEGKVIKRIFEKPSESDDSFWRICGDNTGHGGVVASGKFVKMFDTRVAVDSSDLLNYDDGRHVITSICRTQIDHLYCISTTSRVIWVDERYPGQPLLGWKHHRAFDRTLNVQTIEYDETSLALLSSYRNNQVSAIALGKLDSEPLQCRMSARAVPSASPGCAVVGRALIRHPLALSDSFSLVELTERGSLHQVDLHYSKDIEDEQRQESPPSKFMFQWSDEMHELEKKSKDLHPDYGRVGSSESTTVDLSGLYEVLFGEEAEELRIEQEEEDAEGVYETLENMPNFWQRSDLEEEHLRTLFDVAFGSGEEPLHEARADFLTGTILDSARGHRARNQGRIPVASVAEKAAWHTNIQETLSRISPRVFKSEPVPPEKLDPYHVSREEDSPEADRRESEAREQLALDLALSMDVYSATPFRSSKPREASPSTELQESALLTRAAEQLSLSQKEPPPVTFSYHRPVVNDGWKHYKNSGAAPRAHEAEPQAEDEDKEVEIPLGVRLLLSEWDVDDDPYKYEYVDPYDVEGLGHDSQQPSQSGSRGKAQHRRQQGGASVSGPGAALPPPTQSQAPPTIIAAKSLALTQSRSTGSLPQPSLARREDPRVQTQPRFGLTQAETEPQSSQPMAMANTQVLPGPFGGRQGPKKPAKKRMGGF
ncbi:hypothetical protein M0805_002744 [Coniferiporia weirii]|nr:hypothetical protein M0805_002744 [Coniferiporia weirii]